MIGRPLPSTSSRAALDFQPGGPRLPAGRMIGRPWKGAACGRPLPSTSRAGPARLVGMIGRPFQPGGPSSRAALPAGRPFQPGGPSSRAALPAGRDGRPSTSRAGAACGRMIGRPCPRLQPGGPALALPLPCPHNPQEPHKPHNLEARCYPTRHHCPHIEHNRNCPQSRHNPCICAACGRDDRAALPSTSSRAALEFGAELSANSAVSSTPA
jgi:hypothetical protein